MRSERKKTVLIIGLMQVAVMTLGLTVALGGEEGDGDLDAIFADGGQRHRVCLRKRSGAFTCRDVSGDTFVSFGVALGDVDGDLDAVFADGAGVNYGQRNRVCLGDGSGKFKCSDVSADQNYSQGVALAPPELINQPPVAK